MHENLSSGGRDVLYGRMDSQVERDTHDEANSVFSQFCERA